jgi:hypothetical protein
MANSVLFAKEYVPQKWAVAAHLARSWARIRVLHGAFGSGKSFAWAAEIIRLAVQYGGDWICLASTLGRCIEVCCEPIAQLIHPSRFVRYDHTIPGELGMIVDRGRGVTKRWARIRFKGGHAGNKLSEEMKRGFNATGFWITEASVRLMELLIRLILTRARGSHFPRFMFDWNPAAPGYFLYKRFFPGTIDQIPRLQLDSPWEDGRIIDMKRSIYWQSLTIMHNDHVDPEERKRIIEGAGDESDFYYLRNILGHAVAAEGSIFGIPVKKITRPTIYEDFEEMHPTGSVLAGKRILAPVRRIVPAASTVYDE